MERHTGYSGKSLQVKLNLKQGMRAKVLHAPEGYYDWIGVGSFFFESRSTGPWDFVHLFVNEIKELEGQLVTLREKIAPDGMIWVSWYKKSSRKPTEITEDLIRDTCLPLGLVDVKVCAVTEEWSGLKLVIRRELRKD